jgi:membrane-bound lytic murein transglycosylase D
MKGLSMKKRMRNLLIGFAALTGLVSFFTVIQGFNSDEQDDQEFKFFQQKVKSFRGPDTLYFAEERVPIENFDTRESFDREINTNAYRHSSTILLIKRSHRYFPIIEPILKEYGIPDDFKYIAVAESDLSNAISPVRATGFWQFMEATAKEYGLEINKAIDERYHLEKSTIAACRYFLKSYDKFGNWTMVAASYNRGSSGINKQIDIQKESNYYDLLLPEETSRYIFRILSFKTIFSDPEEYGFHIPADHLYPPVEYTTLKVDTSVSSFAEFAQMHGTNYKILKGFNPWLRQPYLNNDSGKEYKIKIPKDGARENAYND